KDMKNLLKSGSVFIHALKFDLKMKLLICFFAAFLFQVQAENFSLDVKISLHFEDVTLEKVLKEIETLTEYKVLYNDREVDYKRRVSVDFNQVPLSQVLNRLFTGTPIVYETLNK